MDNSSVVPNSPLGSSVEIDALRNYCRGRSILLVGNGQATTSQHLGTAIDKYDVVVRMNHGFPKPDLLAHMGSKSHIWSCAYNRQAWQWREFQDYWNQVDYVLRFGSKGSLHPKIARKSRWYLFENQANNPVYDRIATLVGARPSTGLMTAFFFLECIGSSSTCDVIGFDHFSAPNRVLNSRLPRYANSSHSPELEKAYLDRLFQEHSVKRIDRNV